jgi:ribonuclease BN (tRNA processing enzyme)
MKVIPLGTAGFIPTNGKETISILVIDDKTAILFDCGSGVKRLNDPFVRSELSGINEFNVVFSHFHHDHTIGFSWLLRLSERPINFFVPDFPLIECNGVETLKTLSDLPYFALELEKWPNFHSMTSFNSDDHLNIGGLSVDFIQQIHAGGSVGYRIKDFAFITDTEPRDKHVDFIAECSLVLMDTMHNISDFSKLGSNAGSPAQHGYSEGNGKVANKAKVDKLGLIHIDPFYDNSQINNLLFECKAFSPNAFIPNELEIYEC